MLTATDVLQWFVGSPKHQTSSTFVKHVAASKAARVMRWCSPGRSRAGGALDTLSVETVLVSSSILKPDDGQTPLLVGVPLAASHCCVWIHARADVGGGVSSHVSIRQEHPAVVPVQNIVLRLLSQPLAAAAPRRSDNPPLEPRL